MTLSLSGPFTRALRSTRCWTLTLACWLVVIASPTLNTTVHSISTRRLTTTTLALSSTTRATRDSCSYRGSSERSLTGIATPLRRLPGQACRYRWSSLKPDQGQCWEMRCGIAEIPRNRWINELERGGGGEIVNAEYYQASILSIAHYHSTVLLIK